MNGYLIMTIIFIIILIIAYYLIYLYYYNDWIDPQIQHCINMEQASQLVETGDILLISSNNSRREQGSKFRRIFFNFYRHLLGNREWTHVCIIVKINGEPFVFDVTPYHPEYVFYDFTTNPKQHAGFVHLKTYINMLHGYVGIRKLKHPRRNLIDFEKKVIDTCLHHCNQVTFSCNVIDLLWRHVTRAPLSSLNYKFSCMESVASVFKQLGFDTYNEFHGGLMFPPFVTNQSELFGPVIHVMPGPNCYPRIYDLFQTFFNADKQ